MKRRFGMWYCLLIVVSFSACRAPEGQEYYPATDNGRWEYSLQYTARTGIQKAKMRIRSDGWETIRGQRYLKQVTVVSDIPGAPAEVEYYRLAPDGLYKISGKHKDQPEYIYTPFPLKTGSSWVVHEPDGDITARVEGRTMVELWDRKYENCLQLSYERTSGNHPVKGTEYRAANVGIVKEVYKIGAITLEADLERYDK